MKRSIVVTLVALSALVASVAVAQPWQGWKGCGGWCGGGSGPGSGPGGYGRMYDPAKAETVSGEVVSVEQVTPVRRMGMGIAITLKTGQGNLAVHLGPQWFIERQDIKIVPGDKVEIKGVKAVRGDQNIFIAGEVKKGSEILKLRDDAGIPVWAGWRRGQNM